MDQVKNILVKMTIRVKIWQQFELRKRDQGF